MGSEMCIRDRNQSVLDSHTPFNEVKAQVAKTGGLVPLAAADLVSCLLYTSDAADERSSVDLGGRRIIKKKNR